MFSPPFIVLALSIALPARAWFRVACTDPLVQTRVDPIVSPNITTPSNHVHTVHGASGFRSNSTFNSLRASSCTSCEVAQDLSNYWFPKLYFRDPVTHLYEDVPNGGLLIYYQNRGDGDVSNGGTGLKAFPAGFRMITGNPVLRSKKFAEGQGSQAELAERAVQWSCLRYTNGQTGYDGHGFPTTNCEAGFNARLHFPACWDAKDAFRTWIPRITYLIPLSCLVWTMLFFEITWDVNAFASRWTESQGWPFVYATGDPTGYSWHGDFQNGWDVNALQNAIDQCNNPNDQTGQGVTEACRFLNVTSASVANQCKIASPFNEAIAGNLTALPGCNPLQFGPGDATLFSDANCPGH